MKKYIILTPAIGDMGGAQMYVANKTSYFEKKGWNVSVFYFQSFSKIHIKALEPYIKNWVKDMQYACHFIPNNRLKHDLEFMSSQIKNSDEVIVESQLVSLVGWGELLAQKNNGKHIVNFLEEKINFSSVPLSEYMEFKLRRREIFNASETILKRGFGDSFKKDFLCYTHKQKFFCSNVVDFNQDQPLNIQNADYNILSIGRLDKPYVPTLISEVKKFAFKHSDKRINFMMVGGSNSNLIEKTLRNSFATNSNVNLIMFGYLFPIPINIIRIADVGVSSANSILVTAEQGVPTICIDMYDFDALGVYGFTTNNKFHESRSDKQTLSDALEEVLSNRSIYTENRKLIERKISDSQFEEDLQYLQKGCKDKIYFDIKHMYSKTELLLIRIKWLIHEFMGIKCKKRG